MNAVCREPQENRYLTWYRKGYVEYLVILVILLVVVGKLFKE